MSINSSHHLVVTDFTPSDAGMSCSEIGTEQAAVEKRVADLDARIRDSRQPLAHSALFTVFGTTGPVVISTEDTHAMAAAMDRAIARRDTLGKLAFFRHCQPASA